MKKWKKYEPGWYWVNEKLPVKTWPWVDSERTCILSPNSLTYIYQAVVDYDYNVRARVDAGWIFAEDIRTGQKSVVSYLDEAFSIGDEYFTHDVTPYAHVKRGVDLDRQRPSFLEALFTIQVALLLH